MSNNTKPLPFYKQSFYYTGLLALGAAGLFVYTVFAGDVKSNLLLYYLIGAIVFGLATYYTWKTTCPHCKNLFLRKKKPNGKKI